jgi:hypothetical protein
MSEPRYEVSLSVDLLALLWPKSWAEDWWKPMADDRVWQLTKAGALIAAEIDRLLRGERVDHG